MNYSNPLTASFEARTNRLLDELHVPSLTIAVIHEDSTWSAGYGFSRLPDVKATPRDLYWGGSTTKAFTVATLLALMEEKKGTKLGWADEFTLQTPIRKVLKEEFKMSNDAATEMITFEDAISHRTGLASHDSSYQGMNFTAKDTVKSLQYLPFAAPPRTKYYYVNLMYHVIAYAIEVVSGKSLKQNYSEKILEPLQLKETFFDPHEASDWSEKTGVPIATPYIWDPTEESYYEVDQPIPEMSYGDGGIITSVLDLAEWLRAHINQHPFLSEESHELLHVGRNIADQGSENIFESMCLSVGGWEIHTYRGLRIFSHGGLIGCYSAYMAYIPSRQWGISMLSNDGALAWGLHHNVLYHLIDEMLEVPESQREDYNEHWLPSEYKMQEEYDNFEKENFPERPDPLIPHSLPIEAYGGDYFQPGYRGLTIYLEKNRSGTDILRVQLHTGVSDEFNCPPMRLEHYNEELFTAVQFTPGRAPNPIYGRCAKSTCEFRIGNNGRVAAVGLKIEEDLDEPIWWDRIHKDGADATSKTTALPMRGN